MAMTRTEVEFTRDGIVHNRTQVATLLDRAAEATDLLVVAHGWNNDMADARALYNELLGNVDTLLASVDDPAAPASFARLKDRRFAVCQVFWPSKRFTDEELIPGGGAASAHAANDAALDEMLDRLALDPVRLGQRTVSPVRARIVKQAKALVPRLDAATPDAAALAARDGARREFVFLLRSLLDPAHATTDDGSDQFFTAEPELLFDNLAGDVVVPRTTAGGGATAIGSGGAAGLGDLLTGPIAAARRLANYATYFQMKARAGTVGHVGLAPVVQEVRARRPQIKVHLVGHSFGARLVTAAAHALDDQTPLVSLTLLQAAFSHNALSQDFGDGTPGFFREVLSHKRVSGPIVITHTKNDTAVGVAYPLISRIGRQNASALGDANDPYGGLGRNGAQRTAEAVGHGMPLAAAGFDYRLAPGAVYNLLADAVIRDHGDVKSVPVAWAILSAATAV